MSHGLIWLPLLVVFPLITALGWLERRRQQLFRTWAEGAELSKLDDCGGARLIDGVVSWSTFESGTLVTKDSFIVKNLELVELLALGSGEAPLTDESHGA